VEGNVPCLVSSCLRCETALCLSRRRQFSFWEHRLTSSDYRQGNPYAQQDDYSTAPIGGTPYQQQGGYPQQQGAYSQQQGGYAQQTGGYSQPSGNGSGAYGGGGGYGQNEYEMNSYGSSVQGGSLSDFFAEVNPYQTVLIDRELKLPLQSTL
jgi:hypothetical protein